MTGRRIMWLRLMGRAAALACLTTAVALGSWPAGAAGAAPSWAPTGGMNASRTGHTATLLPTGKVLVAGGRNSSCFPGCHPVLNGAELYDPSAGTWGPTGGLNNRRYFHSATLLPGGQVLVGGGYDSNDNFAHLIPLSSVELYNPATGSWQAAGSFTTIRGHNSATLLPNGKVLAVGSSDPAAIAYDAAELYDPASGTWSPTAAPRSGGITVLLPGGKVLAVRGRSAELYNPSTQAWEQTGGLNVVNADTATLLRSGKVLVTGLPDNSTVPAGAELYDPATGTWSVSGSLNTVFWSGTTTLLPDGRVLMAGGGNPDGDALMNAELYDPGAGTWSPTAALVTGRQGHTATLLQSGKVLAAGGISGNPYDFFDTLRSAELYDLMTAPPNPVDDTQFFVRQHYLDFFSREPDDAGLAFWSDQINSCGGDPACVDHKRQHVSAAFFLSPEFQETGFFVIRIQRVASGKRSDTQGSRVPFAQFQTDARQVGQNFADGQPGSAQVLEQNKQAYAAQVASSAAFSAAFPASLSGAQYVDALFSSAGVVPAQGERQAAEGAFGAGGAAGRAAALRSVADSASVRAAEFRGAFVLMQYFGYLRRDPDQAGFDFWLSKLNDHGGDYISSEMVRSFLISTEYRGRFGPP